MRAHVLWALMAAPLLACGKPKPRIIHFVPPNDDLKRETWQDKTLGISFTTPRDGWIREASHARAPDHAFVVSSDKGRCLGWAYRSPLTEDAPLGPSNAAKAHVRFEGSQEIMDEFMKFESFHARQWELSGREDGKRVSRRATFIVALSDLFTVQAHAEGDDYGDRRRCMDAVIAGFNFL